MRRRAAAASRAHNAGFAPRAAAMSMPPSPDSLATPSRPANRLDRMEWAGAFGDLGTLIPFVAAYIGVLGLHPFGVLFPFGVAMLACGLYYRTPVPVQPMKAIGAMATIGAAQAGFVTPGAVHAAAVATGAVWLALGASGWVARVVRLVPPAVVTGIVLGLGAGFVLQGLRLMNGDWIVALAGAAGTLLLMRNRTLPAMFVLLAFGAGVGALRRPELLAQLGAAQVGLATPAFALAGIGWNEVAAGVLLLALPQLPLTLGNAVIAITDENNRLFPQAPVTTGRIAVSTGLMNLFSGPLGGVPMCHGAGGMAAHVAFGARSGGAVAILGGVLLALAVFFSDGVAVLFQLLPGAVLGVMLCLAGVQLAAGAAAWPAQWRERLVVTVCAAVCLWNVAAGAAAGLALHHLLRWWARRRRLPR